ncbi:SsgA family sporulation/cell division regulator [Streptomyces sp. NPDC002343]
MDQRVSTVTCEVTAHVSVAKGSPVPLPAELGYGITDPYAVRLSLGSSTCRPVTWFFARDLLSGGLGHATGRGDVRVIPGYGRQSGSLRVVLSNSAGTAVVELAAREVAAFLRRTFTLVPAGTESVHLDIDGAIAELIESRR